MHERRHSVRVRVREMGETYSNGQAMEAVALPAQHPAISTCVLRTSSSSSVNWVPALLACWCQIVSPCCHIPNAGQIKNPQSALWRKLTVVIKLEKTYLVFYGRNKGANRRSNREGAIGRETTEQRRRQGSTACPPRFYYFLLCWMCRVGLPHKRLGCARGQLLRRLAGTCKSTDVDRYE